MINRIVKLEFKEDKISDFLSLFDQIKNFVNEFPGCLGMKLYHSINNPSVIITHSCWTSEESLNKYRNSKKFKETWIKIKPWFKEKPLAWSMHEHFNLLNIIRYNALDCTN